MSGDCSDIKTIGYIGWVIFSILATLSWLLGAQRGNSLIVINYHTVSYIIYLLILWYSSGSVQLLCIEDWERDDGIHDISINRILIAITMFCGFVILMLDRLNSYMASQLFVHLVMAFISQGLWILAILSFDSDSRFFWGYSSISLASLLLLHLYSESRIKKARNPTFVRYILTCITLYFVIYYVIMLWGDLFEDFISSLTQEIILLITDTLAILFICITITHYGWAEKPIDTPSNIPGEIDKITQHDLNHHVVQMHVIDSGY